MPSLHRTIWTWYALPLLVSLFLFARIFLYMLGIARCASCDELQVFVVVMFAGLPLVALLFSYLAALLLVLCGVRHPARVAHLTSAPVVVAMAIFFAINTEQYLP